MSFKAIKFVLLGWLLLVLPIGGSSRAADGELPEYEVKAKFLYDFAKFVEWPAENSRADTPIVIGILGRSPIGSELGRIIRDKTINGRRLVIKIGTSIGDMDQCHIVFIGRGQEKPLAEIFKELKHGHALTVGDVKDFTKAGGMINFIIEDRKVWFEINDATARKAGLTISSKLLNLAKKIN